MKRKETSQESQYIPPYYILAGKRVVHCPDVLKWAMWREENNLIILETIAHKNQDIKVITSFIGLDFCLYQMKGSIPVVFETCIFIGREKKEEHYRDKSFDDAIATHNRIIQEITDAN
jgi:hypothetical protein